MVDMVDNMNMVENGNMVDSIEMVDSINMVNIQKSFGYLKLLVDTQLALIDPVWPKLATIDPDSPDSPRLCSIGLDWP